MTVAIAFHGDGALGGFWKGGWEEGARAGQGGTCERGGWGWGLGVGGCVLVCSVLQQRAHALEDAMEIQKRKMKVEKRAKNKYCREIR